MSRLRIAGNVTALAIARGATMLLKLAVAAHLTRVLAPEGYGALGFGLALVAYFTLAVTMGLDTLGTREVARYPDKARVLASDVVGLRLLLSGVAYAGLVGCVLLLPISVAARVVLLVQGGVLFAQAADVEWLYRGVERMWQVAFRNVVADVLQFVGVVVFVRDPGDVVLAAAASTAAAVLVAGGLLVSFRRDFGGLRLRWAWTRWRTLLRSSAALAASALMVAVYYNSGKLMLGLLRGTEEVGFYEAAYRLLGLVLAPSQILYQAFFPSLAIASGDREAMRVRGEAFAQVALGVGLPLAAIGAIVAGPAVEAFAGAAFAPAAGPFAVLMANAALVYVNVVLGQALLAWGAHGSFARAVAAAAVVNIALNAVAIPHYGAVGAAWAMAASEAVAMVGVAVAYRARTDGLPWRPLLGAGGVALVGAAMPAGAASLAGWPLVPTVGIAGVCTVAAAIATGVVPRHVVAAVARRVRRSR